MDVPTSFQPKRFYRELDRLLGEVEGGGLYAEWFPWIVSEIVERFGSPLGIESGRLYVEDEGEFIPSASSEGGAESLVRGDAALERVLHHGVYLFDELTASAAAVGELGAPDTAGLLIDGEPRRVLAFRLRRGWLRDDVDFALNTLRNAIHYRIKFQDMQIDLEQAAEIQRSLLPAAVPELPGYTIAASSIAATAVGGDFYDFVSGDDETSVVAVGDVSGHGLAAALLARDVVTGLRMGSERALKITELVNRLNRVIARSMLSTRFVSLFLAELEVNGNVFYVNAGHPAPWLFGERGLRRLNRGGTILGPLASSSYRRGFAHIDRGDSLVIVTDGVLERANPHGDLFGEERFEEILAPLAGRPAPEILKQLFAAALEYGERRPWADDTTAVVITRSQ
ncbi:MAG: PP2C family protein-serine/threonine phosphatase [bacterium]